MCPICDAAWGESGHELYNICALTCPGCGEMLAVGEDEFHGDNNYSPTEYDG